MTGLFMFVHAFACLLLVVIILMQSGRGGGLTEAFSSAESMFGANTNEFMIKGTTFLAIVFLITSLTLAVMSSQSGKSLMSSAVVNKVAKEVTDTAAVQEKTADEQAAEAMDVHPAQTTTVQDTAQPPAEATSGAAAK